MRLGVQAAPGLSAGDRSEAFKMLEKVCAWLCVGASLCMCGCRGWSDGVCVWGGVIECRGAGTVMGWWRAGRGLEDAGEGGRVGGTGGVWGRYTFTNSSSTPATSRHTTSTKRTLPTSTRRPASRCRIPPASASPPRLHRPTSEPSSPWAWPAEGTRLARLASLGISQSQRSHPCCTGWLARHAVNTCHNSKKPNHMFWVTGLLLLTLSAAAFASICSIRCFSLPHSLTAHALRLACRSLLTLLLARRGARVPRRPISERRHIHVQYHVHLELPFSRMFYAPCVPPASRSSILSKLCSDAAHAMPFMPAHTLTYMFLHSKLAHLLN